MLGAKMPTEGENIELTIEEIPRNVDGEADGSESTAESLTNLKCLSNHESQVNPHNNYSPPSKFHKKYNF